MKKGKLFIINTVGSSTNYLFGNIEKEMNVVFIPDQLAAPKNFFLKITRFLFVGNIPLPIWILKIWFDKEFLLSISQIKPEDNLLIFERINMRALGMIKNLLPKETKKCNWFGNPIYPLFKGKKPYKELSKIKRMGYELVTFDKKDAEEYGMTYHTPFLRFPKEQKEESVNIDFFFCGEPKDREPYLLQLKLLLENAGYIVEYVIPHNKNEYISYEEYLEYVKKSRCIIDIYQVGQSGLTRRPLEALFYNKKLLTNNPWIVEFDFYQKSNIFLLQELNIAEIQKFMQQPSTLIPDMVKMKYDIHSWLEKFMPSPIE